MTRYIIDVRTREEYANRHLEGAINIDFNGPLFVSDISCFEKDAEFIVYCNGGGRAGRAATQMRTLGFTDVTGYGIMGASAATGVPVMYGA
ncbi:MAG: rhodanese-like domain-containing protein [Propionibacteriaceae bacterium]|nr:rhodanese-like domain-containing protein [Propionibacteriaceae bacterium]